VSDSEWEIKVETATRDWLPIELTLQTSTAEPQLEVSWSTNEDPRPRPLPLRRTLLPWAKRQEPTLSSVSLKREIPEIVGGDWERGRQLFHGAANCATCHAVNSKGATVGPDLSNLVYRDYASVLRDIVEPSAALNPDYLAVTIQLKNGQTVGGILVQNFDEKFVLAQANGQTLTFPRAEVVPGTTKPLGISLMPPGLLDALNDQQKKDHLTFLLTVPSAKAR
jgi:putative heme-binding domain-containing protein